MTMNLLQLYDQCFSVLTDKSCRCKCVVTVLKRSVLNDVGPIGLVSNQTICQRSGRVPDLCLHVVSSSLGQRTSIHRKLCGGFSKNTWWRKEGKRYLQIVAKDCAYTLLVRLDREGLRKNTVELQYVVHLSSDSHRSPNFKEVQFIS